MGDARGTAAGAAGASARLRVRRRERGGRSEVGRRGCPLRSSPCRMADPGAAVNAPRLARPMRRDAIPYFAQFASPELIGDIVAGERQAADDPRWRESGAETPEEYAFRARTGCGMACLQMVLAAHDRPVPGLAELWRRCAAHGGYRPDGRKGLHYAGLKAFADAELDLQTRVLAPLALHELVETVRGDEVAFASV